MTAHSAPLPTSPAEARTVLLYLAALAARPVEGEDVEHWDDGPAWTSRPAIALHLSRISEDWAAYSDAVPVRNSLGRVRSRRSLGSRGFLKAVRTISTASREWNQARRRATVEEYDHRREEEYRRAADAHREPDRDYLRDLRAAIEPPLASRHADDDCPVSWRQNASTELVRLRRDFGVEGGDLWTALLRRYEDEDRDDFEAVLAEAASLGFDTSSPLPSSWVVRIEADDWDDDWDDDDDQADDEERDVAPVAPKQRAPEPVREPRAPRVPVFTAPPLLPLSDPLATPTRRTRRPIEPEETVEEMVARLNRERAERETRAARVLPRRESRRWECAACGNSPRHVGVEPPSHCPCGSDRFL